MQSGTYSRASCARRSNAARSKLAAAAAIVLLAAAGAMLRAQGQPPKTFQPAVKSPSPAQVPAQVNNLPKPSPSTLATAPEATPPEPPKPDWPVNDKPVPAKVTWDSNGLTVDANNSSLDEILKDVATATGAKIDGKVGDDRVFGSYGPGSALDVLRQLLDGTAYNVLMIGDQGEGTPRQIVLSNRPSGPAPSATAQNNSEDEVEYEPQPQQMPGIPAMHNPFPAPGTSPEQNQQQMEERRAEAEQRQEQMRQQQQEQQQQQQQAQPPPQ